jgi:hypothetical protein
VSKGAATRSPSIAQRRACSKAFRESPVYLVVDHPAERARVELPATTKAELFSDLRG